MDRGQWRGHCAWGSGGCAGTGEVGAGVVGGKGWGMKEERRKKKELGFNEKTLADKISGSFYYFFSGFQFFSNSKISLMPFNKGWRNWSFSSSSMVSSNSSVASVIDNPC